MLYFFYIQGYGWIVLVIDLKQLYHDVITTGLYFDIYFTTTQFAILSNIHGRASLKNKFSLAGIWFNLYEYF